MFDHPQKTFTRLLKNYLRCRCFVKTRLKMLIYTT